MNHRVGADLDVGVDVGRGRVDERDPGGHQLFVLVLSHDPAHFRQFGAAVDAADFLRVVHDQRFHRQLAAAVDGNEIGQVVLALRVLRRDAAKRVEQRRQVERVDAAVDFPDLPLGRRGVPLLDDPGDPARRCGRCGRSRRAGRQWL